jgi:hypothetical protein
MNELDNPFMNMIEVFKREAQQMVRPSFYLGKIISTQPMKLQFEGLQLSEADFMRNESLKNLTVGDEVLVFDDEKTDKTVIVCKVV